MAVFKAFNPSTTIKILSYPLNTSSPAPIPANKPIIISPFANMKLTNVWTAFEIPVIIVFISVECAFIKAIISPTTVTTISLIELKILIRVSL